MRICQTVQKLQQGKTSTTRNKLKLRFHTEFDSFPRPSAVSPVDDVPPCWTVNWNTVISSGKVSSRVDGAIELSIKISPSEADQKPRLQTFGWCWNLTLSLIGSRRGSTRWLLRYGSRLLAKTPFCVLVSLSNAWESLLLSLSGIWDWTPFFFFFTLFF